MLIVILVDTSIAKKKKLDLDFEFVDKVFQFFYRNSLCDIFFMTSSMNQHKTSFFILSGRKGCFKQIGIEEKAMDS